MALSKTEYELALSRELGFPVFLTDSEHQKLAVTKPTPKGPQKEYQDPFGYLDKKPNDKPENPWRSAAPGGAMHRKPATYAGFNAKMSYGGAESPAPGVTPTAATSATNPWIEPTPTIAQPSIEGELYEKSLMDAFNHNLGGTSAVHAAKKGAL